MVPTPGLLPFAAMTTYLLERCEEIAAITRHLAGAVSSEGSSLLIEGAAGTGKSSLLREAARLASDSDVLTLRARGGELDQQLPFGGVSQLFGSSVDRADSHVNRGMLAGAAGAVPSILMHAGGARQVAWVDAPFRALHSLYWLVANLATDKPLLLLVDDWQWLDPPTKRFLAHLANRLDELAVLLVVATRPQLQEVSDEPLRQLSSTAAARLRLGPLTDRAGVELAARVAPAADPAHWTEYHRLSAGNPLLLLASIRALPPESLTGGVLDLDRVSLTEVSDWSLTRLGELGDDALVLARAVAVLGPSATLARVAAITGLSLDDTADAVERLVRGDFLDGGRPLGFTHPVVHAAVYGNMAPAIRSRWHERAVFLLGQEAVAPSLLAIHLLVTDPGDSGRTVNVLRSAASDALGAGSPELAVRYLRRAIQESVPGPLLAASLHDLGIAEAHAHEPMALDHLEAAQSQTEDPLESARITVSLADISMLAATPGRALPVIVKSLEELADADEESRLLLIAQRAILEGMIGLRSFGPEMVPEVDVAGLKGTTAGEQAVLAVHASSLSLSAQPAVAAAAAARRALQHMPAQSSAVAPFVTAVNALMTSDCFVEAERIWQESLARSRADGSVAGVINALTMRSFSLLARGALLEATADVQDAERLARESGVHAMWFYALAFQVEILVRRGQPDNASALLAASPLPTELPDHLPVNLLIVSRGLLKLHLGEPEAALTDLLLGGERLERRGVVTPTVSFWRSYAAMALRQTGRIGEARELAQDELTLSRCTGAPRPVGVSLRTVALLSDSADRRPLLQQSLEFLEHSEARLERSETLLELGSAQRRQGEQRAAREPLGEALQAADACGATGLATRALHELRMTGARPRRRATTGVRALTPAERRVADLAASGLGNREIAQQLFVTTRTVEVHLNSVFRKLAIGRRQQISASLAEDS